MTNLDLLASGRQMVDEHIASLPEVDRERLRAAIARGKQATARVHAQAGVGALRTIYTAGTGVFVAASDGSPLVLTAGHTLVESGPEPAVYVSTRGEPGLEGELVACAHDRNEGGPDFAVVRCSGAPPSGVVLAARAAPRQGALVVALGYPDSYGIDDAGHLRRLGGPGSSVLEPLALLLEVTQVQPLVLAPVAGPVPLGGFSGGGFFDLDGNVIGVLTSIREDWEPGGDTVTLRVQGCSVTAIQPIP